MSELWKHDNPVFVRRELWSSDIYIPSGEIIAKVYGFDEDECRERAHSFMAEHNAFVDAGIKKPIQLRGFFDDLERFAEELSDGDDPVNGIILTEWIRFIRGEVNVEEEWGIPDYEKYYNACKKAGIKDPTKLVELVKYVDVLATDIEEFGGIDDPLTGGVLKQFLVELRGK